MYRPTNDPVRPNMFCKFRYTSTNIITTGTAGVCGTEQIFRLNSLYDPDYTNVGRQPYAFDQLMQLYRKYIVHGVHINIVWEDPDADSIVCCAMVQPSSGTLALTGRGIDEVKEKSGVITRCLNDSGKQVLNISQYIPMHKLEGITKQQYSNSLDLYAGTASAGPAITPYLRLAVGSARNTGGSTCVSRVTFTFMTQLYEREDHGSS